MVRLIFLRKKKTRWRHTSLLNYGKEPILVAFAKFSHMFNFTLKRKLMREKKEKGKRRKTSKLPIQSRSFDIVNQNLQEGLATRIVPDESVLDICNTLRRNLETSLSFGQTRRAYHFTNPLLGSSLTQSKPNARCHYAINRHRTRKLIKLFTASLSKTNLVVEAWAMMLPPMGLIWGPAKIAEPSTCATTWFVITTATPNCTYIVSPMLYC